MEWLSFCLGLLVGVIAGIVLLVFVLYLIVRPHLLLAKKSKQKTDLFVQQWAENIAKSGQAKKFGGGNS